MSINPVAEVRYRYRLADEQLRRAEMLLSLKDWAGTILFSQLAVESFAKSVIAIFEVPTWTHDPSDQLLKLIDKLPANLVEEAKELALLVRELAPEHGRSSYGEPTTGMLPSEIYKEDHALNSIKKAERAKKIVDRFMSIFNIKP